MDASGIRMNNLRLVAVEPFHVEALSRDKRELAEVLGVAVPDGWPQFPEAFAPPDGGSRRSARPPPARGAHFSVHPRGPPAALGAPGPAGWPQSPEASAPPDGGSRRSERPPTDWRAYFFVHPRGRALVGNGGFTGDPGAPGGVGVGYAVR